RSSLALALLAYGGGAAARRDRSLDPLGLVLAAPPALRGAPGRARPADGDRGAGRDRHRRPAGGRRLPLAPAPRPGAGDRRPPLHDPLAGALRLPDPLHRAV